MKIIFDGEVYKMLPTQADRKVLANTIKILNCMTRVDGDTEQVKDCLGYLTDLQSRLAKSSEE